MRVCIVADSASVRFGGEAILPYHYFRLLAKRGVDVWLVVHDRTRPELEAALPEYRDRILYSPDLWMHRLLSHLISILPRRVAESSAGLLSLLITQYYQRKLIRKLVWREGIDIVHQPSPVSPRLPSLMFNLGVPVVIGPLNGGMDYPPGFRGQESAVSHGAIGMGRGLTSIVNRLLPGKVQASTILVANERTRVALPSGVMGRILELPENAVDLESWTPSCDPGQPPTKPKQFVFMGRLVDWKRLDIVLRALAMVPEASMVVLGDGAMRTAWEQLSRDLNLDHRVAFLGWLPQVECGRYVAQSAALVLPSVYECGGAVVLEAMALCRPVIATRWGGPADYLDEHSGILIHPTSAEAMVEQFAAAMTLLADHPEIGLRLGAAGKQRVEEHFSWCRKIDRIEEIYREAAAPAMVPTPMAGSLTTSFDQ